jgi:hypothetical protein
LPKPKTKERGRKGKVTMMDLPTQTATWFGSVFIPNVKACVGLIPAWSEPSVDMLKKLWDEVYSLDDIQVQVGWEPNDTVPVLVVLYTLHAAIC